MVDQSRMAGLRWEQRHHDMQNMAKMMMMMTFVKIGVMKLKTGLTYMNIQENKILHLNCVKFFWSSKKWFGLVKVLPLLDQMSSEVQSTLGMTEYIMHSYAEQYYQHLFLFVKYLSYSSCFIFYFHQDFLSSWWISKCLMSELVKIPTTQQVLQLLKIDCLFDGD